MVGKSDRQGFNFAHLKYWVEFLKLELKIRATLKYKATVEAVCEVVSIHMYVEKGLAKNTPNPKYPWDSYIE